MKVSVLEVALLFLFLLCGQGNCLGQKNDVEDRVVDSAIQFRFARPTNQLAKIKAFYMDGLGLEELGSFTGHSGYSGVMLGLPHSEYHLEFTAHEEQEPLPKPSKENLLVLYFESEEKYEAANRRLQAYGVQPVEPENPDWKGKSQTYEDPDKWRVVLLNGVYKPK